MARIVGSHSKRASLIELRSHVASAAPEHQSGDLGFALRAFFDVTRMSENCSLSRPRSSSAVLDRGKTFAPSARYHRW
jgi:hypothetical protein